MGQHLIVMGDGRADRGGAEGPADLQRRQLPQPTEQARGGAPHQHDLARALDPQRRPREQRQLVRLLALRDDGQLAGAPGRVRAARGRERAREAARRGRRARHRAELHEPLVEIARGERARQRDHQLAGDRPDRALAGGGLDVELDRERARDHAGDVAVDERRALAERDRRDRAGRVGADAGHRAQLARPRRERAGADRLRTGVEAAGARVVAEAGPRGEHVVERRRRERGHRGKPRHPALPVGDHRGHAGLLQHDLADPDRVRIAGAAPRQVAPHAREVARDRGGDVVHPPPVVARGRRACNPG